MAAILLLPVLAEVKIAALIAHGGITGGALTVAVSFLFESLSRGVTEKRRGQALSLGYGVGPLLAVVASQGTQWVLPQREAGTAAGLDFPWTYAVLFAASVPIMGLAAFLASRFVIPCPSQEPPRQPFWSGVFGGLGDFLGSRVLRTTAAAAILIFAGYHIEDNMKLYTQYVLHAAPEEHLGNQQTLRFSFKILTGLLMGWLLTRTNPKAVLVVTALLGLAGVIWAPLSTGLWYYLSFALIGGGELFGVYVTNYILACSPSAQVRRNMGFTVMLLMPAAPAGPLFGGIADHLGAIYSEAVGFRLSFVVAACFIGLALALVLTLPARPRPEQSL
jgi:hypothetical protein